MYIEIDQETCIGCGVCIDACPPQVISLVDNKAVIDQNLCRKCGRCIDACPAGAIERRTDDEQLSAPTLDESPSLARSAMPSAAPAPAKRMGVSIPVQNQEPGMLHNLSLSLVSALDRVVKPTQSSFAGTLRRRQRGGNGGGGGGRGNGGGGGGENGGGGGGRGNGGGGGRGGGGGGCRRGERNGDGMQYRQRGRI